MLYSYAGYFYATKKDLVKKYNVGGGGDSGPAGPLVPPTGTLPLRAMGPQMMGTLPGPGIPGPGMLGPGIPGPGIPAPGIPGPGIPGPGIPGPMGTLRPHMGMPGPFPIVKDDMGTMASMRGPMIRPPPHMMGGPPRE